MGPREGSITLSYEMSLADLNRYPLPKPGDSAALAKWQDQVGQAQSRINHQMNFKFSAQASYVDRYSVVLPSDISLMQAIGHRYTGTATFGSLVLGSGGAQFGRIDGSLEYDNDSSDPMHKEHLLASVTYTQKLGDSLTLPIGIAYADHEDLLTDVQAHFSAHFGLRFKFDSTPSNQGSPTPASQNQ